MATETTQTVTDAPSVTHLSPSPLLTDLNRDGYVIIPNALSPEQLTSLREAAGHITDLARKGQWPYIRTLPKQFPPWSSDPSNGIWGVQHLMHPDMPGQPLFAASYFTDAVVRPVMDLIGCTDDSELIMELYNLLVRPDSDFELRWHRDDIAATATAEEELARLNKPAWHAQWNLALYDDASLIVVPGSHARARTDAERAADPFEKNMPGQKIVQMKAGDVVFYNNNILHRGAYSASVERATLHGSIGHVKGNKERARNVLQHGVGAWVDKVDFSALPEELRGRAENMRRRLKQMGDVSGDVGFAHDD
ncbi:phytanoyl-CoA dioxygenase [Trichodelitschia bisporula]|uniref:Phytanoyl-CoA dioxygenase n=1 Tax=Trichodelitschia bisporula TaxID=703511 RepID=A0A6G1I0Y4_9PEZI|nr:phytanoyl-CoA dioxygenase [Trichodelitschia bisporula]